MKRKLASAAVGLFMASTAWLLFAACRPSPGASPEESVTEDEPTVEELDGLLVEGHFCGGIAGLPCPQGLVCEDDLNDDCDPADGGSDCGGVCLHAVHHCNVPERRYTSTNPEKCAVLRLLCPRSHVPFSDRCGCGCEPEPKHAGLCGENRCRPDEYCCNASCGICAPLGGACIQLECE